ncbi:hypothetical protein [Sulfurospirillum arcachonense]|uniref:hypothetical protein n=1 Tax=Sulfurospirillum arcachonense TaxID=57666 RepID=UPI0004690C0C|nr:hypothetical protein [Sulfurospirillum arcachonense]
MKNKIFLGVQVFVGLMLFVFGLNGFLQFIPLPVPAAPMAEYMSALLATGFIFPIVATIQIIVGLSYITNKFTSLMTIMVLPIMINAFLGHLFLDIGGIAGSAIIILGIVVVMIKDKAKYKEIFKS